MAQTYEKPSITAELAEEIIKAAAGKAEEIGVPMVIAVVDESGILKAFRRMDGAALLSVDIAQNKAYTAVSPSSGVWWRLSNRCWREDYRWCWLFRRPLLAGHGLCPGWA